MEFLKLNKIFWTSIGFYSDENTNRSHRIIGYFGNILIITVHALLNISSLMFLYKNCAESLEMIFSALCQITVGSNAMITFFILSKNKTKFVELIISFQNDVKPNLQIYKNAENSSRMFVKYPIMFCFVIYDFLFPILICLNWLYEVVRDQVDYTKWPVVYVLW